MKAAPALLLGWLGLLLGSPLGAQEGGRQAQVSLENQVGAASFSLQARVLLYPAEPRLQVKGQFASPTATKNSTLTCQAWGA